MTIKSNTYRLQELVNVIENNIKQTEDAIKLHKEMYDILKEAKRTNVSDEYLHDVLGTTIESLEQSINKKQFDLQLVKDILARCDAHKNDEFNEIDAVVTMMLHVFTDIKIEEVNPEETKQTSENTVEA